jgi:hypothetical protein
MLSAFPRRRVVLHRREEAMQLISLIWGIFAILGMLIAFTPMFGALNWLNIPFAGIGAIVSAVAVARSAPEAKGKSVAGLICCGIAVLFGFIRLVLGLGVF